MGDLFGDNAMGVELSSGEYYPVVDGEGSFELTVTRQKEEKNTTYTQASDADAGPAPAEPSKPIIESDGGG